MSRCLFWVFSGWMIVACATTDTVPQDSRLAISLSYDDALDSQLDYALPALNERGLKATFYIFPYATGILKRQPEWKEVAQQGHELGNHTLFHACSKKLSGGWVQDHQNLDQLSVEDMVRNLKVANAFLEAMDGKTERTFTPGCGQTMTKTGDYLDVVEPWFLGVKYIGKEHPFEILMGPNGHTAEEMIAFIEAAPANKKVVNILFHGVNGDHLSVTAEEHNKLLDYLVANENKYWVDTYINIRRKINSE